MRTTAASLTLALVLAPTLARASPTDCRPWRIGTGVATVLSLAALGGGVAMVGDAYAKKQDAHEQPTLGAYHAAFRDADRLNTAGGILLGVGVASGVIIGTAALVAFTGRGHIVCADERPRAALGANSLQVRF